MRMEAVTPTNDTWMLRQLARAYRLGEHEESLLGIVDPEDMERAQRFMAEVAPIRERLHQPGVNTWACWGPGRCLLGLMQTTTKRLEFTHYARLTNLHILPSPDRMETAQRHRVVHQLLRTFFRTHATSNVWLVDAPLSTQEACFGYGLRVPSDEVLAFQLDVLTGPVLKAPRTFYSLRCLPEPPGGAVPFRVTSTMVQASRRRAKGLPPSPPRQRQRPDREAAQHFLNIVRRGCNPRHGLVLGYSYVPGLSARAWDQRFLHDPEETTRYLPVRQDPEHPDHLLINAWIDNAPPARAGTVPTGHVRLLLDGKLIAAGAMSDVFARASHEVLAPKLLYLNALVLSPEAQAQLDRGQPLNTTGRGPRIFQSVDKAHAVVTSFHTPADRLFERSPIDHIKCLSVHQAQFPYPGVRASEAASSPPQPAASLEASRSAPRPPTKPRARRRSDVEAAEGTASRRVRFKVDTGPTSTR